MPGDTVIFGRDNWVMLEGQRLCVAKTSFDPHER
jgi:hypothetical protein